MSGVLPVGYKPFDQAVADSGLGQVLQDKIAEVPQVAAAAGQSAALATVGQPTLRLSISTPTALTAEAHGARWLTLTGSGNQLALDWADVGDGFGCTLSNHTTYWCKPSLTGFSDALIVMCGGYVTMGVPPGGVATLFTEVVDGERIARLAGDVE